ncbi:MAG: ral secretion pathway protein, partial [Campylobacterota bacterium]|nr:ral secretion pathway protein [Campylobacterota bacterium]
MKLLKDIAITFSASRLTKEISNSYVTSGKSFIMLAEADKSARQKAADILNIPFVQNKDEFERQFMADYLKQTNEASDEYAKRTAKMSSAKIILAVRKQDHKKFCFVIDPTSHELDEFCSYPFALMGLDTYKEIVGISSNLTISFDEGQDMPSYIKKIVQYAYDEKATDIDIAAMEASMSIKLKISGEWGSPIGVFPVAYKISFLTALCSMAVPSPVDYKPGKELTFKAALKVHGIDMVFRVGIVPTAFGENIALRSTADIGELTEIEDLGFSKNIIDYINTLVSYIHSPKKGGVVFITGETGSGKTTLLSAVESRYLTLNKKVSTSEDPVERKKSHPFLNQTEVGGDTGLTHMDALVAFLRQNSDVIVIGECRRADELVSVINAALSGLFAYTNLHTGIVEETLIRLKAMGVDPSLL